MQKGLAIGERKNSISLIHVLRGSKGAYDLCSVPSTVLIRAVNDQVPTKYLVYGKLRHDLFRACKPMARVGFVNLG